MHDSDFVKNIGGIEAELNNYQIDKTNLEELCKIFERIRTPLESTLPFIELIPVYGKTIVKAIRLMIAIAQTACARA